MIEVGSVHGGESPPVAHVHVRSFLQQRLQEIGQGLSSQNTSGINGQRVAVRRCSERGFIDCVFTRQGYKETAIIPSNEI